jgi:hypothetical protein
MSEASCTRLADRAVIGVVIEDAMGQHQVGFPAADFPNDPSAVVEAVFQFSVGIIPDRGW